MNNFQVNAYVSNEYRQVTIRNEGSYTAKFSLSYSYNGKFYSKSSNDIKTHKSASLQFPKGSTALTVIVSYFYNTHESTLLYRENFNDFQNRCYLLQGTKTTATCERTPCSCNNLYQYNPCCNPCCTCKYNYYM